MAPRAYTQERRAETTAATRRRVIDAAIGVYREAGVARASIQEIAARADVSRGTVINHFGGAEGLLDAVLDRAVVDVEYPMPADLAGTETVDDRIRRFVDVTFRFFERSGDWWFVFASDMELPALKARERHYWEVFARFQAAAFGELASDRIVAATVRAFVDYGPLSALRGAGLSLEEAIDVVGDALVGVAQRRQDESGEGG